MDRIIKIEVFVKGKRVVNYKIKDGNIEWSKIETDKLKNGVEIKTYYEAE